MWKRLLGERNLKGVSSDSSVSTGVHLGLQTSSLGRGEQPVENTPTGFDTGSFIVDTGGLCPSGMVSFPKRGVSCAE